MLAPAEFGEDEYATSALYISDLVGVVAIVDPSLIIYHYKEMDAYE